MWGATGEQEWTPALTTGVDWKSLTIPACLPITTDYFPDQRSLQNDFVVSDYSLIPDDVNADYGKQGVSASGRRPLETQEVFRELISQRLTQGFQMIVLPTNKHLSADGNDKEYLLSIGRIFHKIVLKGSTILVTSYRPRHPYPTCNIHYRYRLQAPDHETYEVIINGNLVLDGIRHIAFFLNVYFRFHGWTLMLKSWKTTTGTIWIIIFVPVVIRNSP